MNALARARLAPLLSLVALAACSGGSAPHDAPPAPSATSSAAREAPTSAPAPAAAPVVPASVGGAFDPNPLRLPPRKVTLDAGKRVFTFSDAMLANAKPGSTLVLYAATVTGIEGDDLI